MRHQTTHAIYRFLYSYYEEHGLSPSQQEIADACYLTRASVSRHLDKLTIWGWVSRENGKARSIRPLVSLEVLDGEGAAEKSGKIVLQNSYLL